jgi:hypothetical protein
MALANYSDLKTAIGAWMFDQGSLLSSYYDDFIDAAEARFNYGFGAIGDHSCSRHGANGEHYCHIG